MYSENGVSMIVATSVGVEGIGECVMCLCGGECVCVCDMCGVW